MNRLTQVTEPDGKSTYYEYDAAGNRTKENVMIIYGGMDSFYSKETNYCYNSQNWLTNTTTWEYDYINYTNKSKYVYYSYDNNGNQLSTFVEEYSGDGSSNLYDSMYPKYPRNYNVFGGVTPIALYNSDCFFVTSPTR
ncbi:RHS repeat domain-containing protein, partial [Anaerobium acetethylicum]